MLTSVDFVPYEFYAISGGKKAIVGFDVDIAKYIAKELKLELQINETYFDGLIPAIQAKEADFVMGGIVASAKPLDFSVTYYDVKEMILALKGKNYTNAAQFNGKKVGVLASSISAQNLRQISSKVKDLKIISFDKAAKIIQSLRAQEIDLAIIEDGVISVVGEADLEFNVLLKSSKLVIAFPKGSKHVPEFNRVLKKMQDNGEIERLTTKWLRQKKEAP